MQEKEAYIQMTKTFKLLNNQYRREFLGGEIDLFYSYAKKEVDEKKLTWDEFINAFELSGSKLRFFPKYCEIIEIVKSTRYREGIKTLKLDTGKSDKETAKGFIAEIRRRMKGGKQ